jgi:Txe/YoeB family toxin of toxin-antitoxin system
MSYEVVFTKHAEKDWAALESSPHRNLVIRAKEFVELLRSNPLQSPPPFKKLNGEFTGLFSRRLSQEHRFVYQVYEREKVIKVVCVWGHFT